MGIHSEAVNQWTDNNFSLIFTQYIIQLLTFDELNIRIYQQKKQFLLRP